MPGPMCEHGRRRRDCGQCDGSGVYKQHLRGVGKRGISNDLDEERYRWLISQPCAYCGSAPAGGVDRVKNDWGYTILNSVPCCASCNFLKKDVPAREFITRVARIVAWTASYEHFKTRWITARTGGPECLYSNTNVTGVTSSPSTVSNTRSCSESSTKDSTVKTAVNSSISSSRGPLGFDRVSTARAVDCEHSTYATETFTEGAVLPHTSESEVDEGFAD